VVPHCVWMYRHIYILRGVKVWEKVAECVHHIKLGLPKASFLHSTPAVMCAELYKCDLDVVQQKQKERFSLIITTSDLPFGRMERKEKAREERVAASEFLMSPLSICFRSFSLSHLISDQSFMMNYDYSYYCVYDHLCYICRERYEACKYTFAPCVSIRLTIVKWVCVSLWFHVTRRLV